MITKQLHTQKQKLNDKMTAAQMQSSKHGKK